MANMLFKRELELVPISENKYILFKMWKKGYNLLPKFTCRTSRNLTMKRLLQTTKLVKKLPDKYLWQQILTHNKSVPLWFLMGSFTMYTRIFCCPTVKMVLCLTSSWLQIAKISNYQNSWRTICGCNVCYACMIFLHAAV